MDLNLYLDPRRFYKSVRIGQEEYGVERIVLSMRMVQGFQLKVELMVQVPPVLLEIVVALWSVSFP